MSEQAKIINVDDNEAARYAKGRLLSHAGFVVHDSGTGTDALELVALHSPDLVLLDVNLPDIDGIEVCRRIKSSPDSASVMVLQISASAITAPHATAALNNGADTYLTEPVDPDVLVATVRALLRIRTAERALSTANAGLHAANLELERSNEDLQQFAFIASHDLQEPLRTVSSFAGLLKKSAGERLDDSEQQYLDYITQGSQRMRTLIDDLLRYSQVGRKPASSRSVDLNKVLPWVVENLRQRITESAADIAWEALPTVTADETQIGHVLQNLISNSIKYRRSGVQPVIRINADKENQQWVIRVRDNGVGVAREYQQMIFAPFKRLHGKDIPGTGIGLALCRRVIEAHEGRIWVESTPGEYSMFAFTLPAKTDFAL